MSKDNRNVLSKFSEEHGESCSSIVCFNRFEASPHSMLRCHHRLARAKALAVLRSELVTQSKWIRHERKQQREIEFLVQGSVIDVDGTRFADDRPEQ